MPAVMSRLLLAFALVLLACQVAVADDDRFDPQSCKSCQSISTCLRKRYAVGGLSKLVPDPSCNPSANCKGPGKPCDCKSVDQHCLNTDTANRSQCVVGIAQLCGCTQCLDQCNKANPDNEKLEWMCVTDHCPDDCQKCTTCANDCMHKSPDQKACMTQNCTLCTM